MEAPLVRRAGLAFETIPAAGVHGVGIRAMPGNLRQLGRGVLAARRALRRFRPDVLLFTGGYVGVPVALAGLAIPKVVYVPDIEPGLALRLLARMAEVVLVTADESRRYFRGARRVLVTGYPTRRELQGWERTVARSRLDLRSGPVVLVLGGSRGARAINEALWSCLRDLLKRTQIVHLTGELDWPRVEAIVNTLPASAAENYHAFPFLHEEMGAALASADLAIGRAGASSLGELPLFGLPAILVPYPHAWRYQKINAAFLVARGAAIELPNDRLAEMLLDTTLGLLADPQRLSEMSAAARSLATPRAALAIAAEVERLAGVKGGTDG